MSPGRLSNASIRFAHYAFDLRANEVFRACCHAARGTVAVWRARTLTYTGQVTAHSNWHTVLCAVPNHQSLSRTD